MATTKNIIMKQFNGTDYDTLYPKTKVEQIENLTPSSVGAVAKSGDIMTGQLSVPAFALTNYNAALEIGKNIDFHAAGSTNDYDARLAYDSGALLFRMHGGDYKTMLHTGNLSVLGVAKIQAGSYVGTGTYGANNKTVITCSFKPRLVMVFGDYVDSNRYTGDIGIFWGNSGFLISGSAIFGYNYFTGRNEAGIEFTDTGLSLYSTETPNRQLNTASKTFNWIAVG